MSITSKKIINSILLIALVTLIAVLAYRFTGGERRLLTGSILDSATPTDITSIEFVTPKGTTSPINNVVTIEGVFVQYDIDAIPPTVNIVNLAGDTDSPYLDCSLDGVTDLVLGVSDSESGVAGCRWSDVDVPYASMTNNCSGTTTSICSFGDITTPYISNTRYYACADNSDNASNTVSITFIVGCM
jgi:hypothetical protein